MKVSKRDAFRNTNLAEGREIPHSQDASESGGIMIYITTFLTEPKIAKLVSNSISWPITAQITKYLHKSCLNLLIVKTKLYSDLKFVDITFSFDIVYKNSGIIKPFKSKKHNTITPALARILRVSE